MCTLYRTNSNAIALMLPFVLLWLLCIPVVYCFVFSLHPKYISYGYLVFVFAASLATTISTFCPAERRRSSRVHVSTLIPEEARVSDYKIMSFNAENNFLCYRNNWRCDNIRRTNRICPASPHRMLVFLDHEWPILMNKQSVPFSELWYILLK